MKSRLSVAQLADTWGVSRQHVYNLIERGELQAVRIGALVRIRPEDVEAYECRDRKQTDQPIPSPSAAPAITSSGGKTAARSGYHAALRTRQKRAGSLPSSRLVATP